MSNSPLVSIITPSYNQAAYLEATICSVLAQDYHPIEYIIVDGASTDGSLEIIRKYASLAPERLIWWTSEPDSGQAEAINKGFQRARGEIIAWINSDDIYLPGAVRHAVAAMEADPGLGMVFGDAVSIDAQGIPINRLTFGDWGRVELAGFRIICQPAVFMRRVALENAGYLDPNYHFMLDHHLWIRIARQAPIKYSGGRQTGLWAAARHHASAKNVSQAEAFSAEILRLLAWVQNLPDFTVQNKTFHNHTRGGAYRLNARYLLDAGRPRAALRSYLQAFRAYPGFALKHWHRILYALLGTLGLGSLTRVIDGYRWRQSTRRSQRLAENLRIEMLRTLEGLPPSDHRTSSMPPPTTPERWPGIRLK
jgi:glycosyltransferase involved in cell wall biosynthesis